MGYISLALDVYEAIQHHQKKKNDPNYTPPINIDYRVKTQDGQFIVETGLKKHILVTSVENNIVSGINIKFKAIHFVCLALRIVSIVLSVLMFFFVTIFWIIPIFKGELSSVLNGRQADMAITILLGFFLFMVLSIFLTRFIKTTPKEKFVREQFYKITGYYIMPEWMFDKTFDSYYQAMRQHYVQHIGNYEWKGIIKTLNTSDKWFDLAFCLTYMDNIRDNDKISNKTLLDNFQKH